MPGRHSLCTKTKTTKAAVYGCYSASICRSCSHREQVIGGLLDWRRCVDMVRYLPSSLACIWPCRRSSWAARCPVPRRTGSSRLVGSRCPSLRQPQTCELKTLTVSYHGLCVTTTAVFIIQNCSCLQEVNSVSTQVTYWNHQIVKKDVKRSYRQWSSSIKEIAFLFIFW